MQDCPPTPPCSPGGQSCLDRQTARPGSLQSDNPRLQKEKNIQRKNYKTVITHLQIVTVLPQIKGGRRLVAEGLQLQRSSGAQAGTWLLFPSEEQRESCYQTCCQNFGKMDRVGA